MSAFKRDINAALAQEYDLIVVGGGIYGMALTLEAARRRVKTLLIERDDFGGATSLNSLRILHGGLRYLQHLELRRFFESVSQRSWFMQNFAPLCRVLPCLMPLYGRGLKRKSVFKAALLLNDLLSGDSKLGQSRVLSSQETVSRFPLAPREGLEAGALWFDGQILSPQRLHMELLHWAVNCGATVLNYVEATGLKRQGSKAAGLVTNAGEFNAPVIINAAGPWCREVATRLDKDRPELMTPSLTFNVVLNIPPPSDAAVAVQSSRMYFITPHRAGITFAGTVHRAWEGMSEPSEVLIEEFITGLNAAIPGWNVQRKHVLRVTAGVLPSLGPGKADMAHQSTFVKHDIDGLFSLCGVKYTTAQAFAARTLSRIFGEKPVNEMAPDFGNRARFVEPAAVMALSDAELRKFAEDEAVTCAEDLLERRMDWIVDEGKKRVFEDRLEHLLKPEASVNA